VPIACDPKATFKITLDGDKYLPPATRPYFIYRHLTLRQQQAMAKTNDELDMIGDGDDMFDTIIDCVTTNLVGWKNMTDPATGNAIKFSKDKMADLVNYVEIMELISKLVLGLPDEDKKKFDSQSDLDLKSSAKDAKAPENAPSPSAQPI